MALNFLGLGFALGAQDKGLANALKTTTSGLMDITKSMTGIAVASAKAVIRPPDFGPAASLAGQLAGDVKLTTTGMEAFGVAASKATSAGLAGLNLTDKAFRQAQSSIASTAFSMNTDVGAVTKSFAALQQAGVDVKKVGFKSFEQYQKFIEVTGADSTAFASALGIMNKQMGMTPDEVKDAMTAVAAIGKKFNIGREAVAGMSDTVKMLNENSNLLPQNWSPARMSVFLKGTTAVAGALTSIGFSADEAMTASKSLTKGLLAGEKGMASLYSGLQSDLPEAFKVMTENLGDATASFQMLQSDPKKFMLSMGTMVDKVNSMNLNPEAMNRFRLQMQGTFGPEVMAMFNKKGFGKLKPALESTGDAMKDQGKIVEDLASKYQDGRTYAERFAIVQDQMHTSLKQIPGVMKDGVYLDKYRQQTKALVSEMGNLAGKGGVVGKATTMLIEFANRGVGGALAAHTKWGLALSEGIKLIQPMLQYLPALKMAFTALASPIGIVVAGLAGLYFLFKDLARGKDSVVMPIIKKLSSELPQLLDKVIGMAKDIFKTVYDVLSKVDWAAVFATIGDGLGKALNAIYDVVAGINWNKVGQVLGAVLSKAFDVAGDLLRKSLSIAVSILQWLSDVDWAAIGSTLMGYLMKIVDPIVDAVIYIFKNLPEILKKSVTITINALLGLFTGLENYLTKKFPESAGYIEKVFDYIKMTIKLTGFIINKAIDLIVAAFKIAYDVIVSVFKTVAGAVMAVVNPIVDAFTWAWNGISGAFSAMWNNGLSTVIDGIVTYFKVSIGIIVGIFEIAWKVLKLGFKAAWLVIDTIFVAPMKWAFKLIYEAISAVASWLWDKLQPAFKAIGDAAKWVWDNVLSPVFDSIKSAVSSIGDALSTVGGWFSDAYDAASSAIDTATDAIDGSNKELKLSKAALGAVGSQADVADSAFGRMYNALHGVNTEGAKSETAFFSWGLIPKRAMEAAQAAQDLADKLKLINENSLKDVNIGMISKTSLKNEEDRYAAIGALNDTFVANAKVAMGDLSKVNSAYKEADEKALEQISQNHIESTKRIMLNQALSDEQRQKSLSANEAAYASSLDNISTMMKKQRLESSTGAAGMSADIQKGLEALVSSSIVASKNVKQVTGDVAAGTGEITQMLADTTDEQLKTIRAITTLKPQVFKDNMAIVQKSFLDFLNVMDDKGKKLNTSIAKSFNETWATMRTGWETNELLIQTFSALAQIDIQKYWDKVMQIASEKVVDFLNLTSKIEIGLSAMARTLNIMDLLAGPDQITRWAASVVSALSYAFQTGGAADAMISASYTKALQMAREVSAQASTATPDTAAMKATAPSVGATSATYDLLSHIDRPAWTNKAEVIPATLTEINNNIIALMKQMGSASPAKPTTTTPTPIRPPQG